MSDLPSIAMTGGLMDEPELRFTPSGRAVANFRLAGKKNVQDSHGQWVDGAPIYLTVTAWGALAEHCAETLTRKGQRVTVVGRLQQDWWDKDGPKSGPGEGVQSKFVIVAETVAVDLKFSNYEEKRTDPATTGTRPPEGDPWASPKQDTEPPF